MLKVIRAKLLDLRSSWDAFEIGVYAGYIVSQDEKIADLRKKLGQSPAPLDMSSRMLMARRIIAGSRKHGPTRGKAEVTE